MTRFSFNFCLMCLQAVFFACFLVGVLAAYSINCSLYLVLAYGWVNVRTLNLHFTSYRPMILSNGDKLSELADFGIFVATLVLGLTITGVLASAIERLTRRLGKEIHIFKRMDALAKEDRRSPVFGITAMALAIATTFFTIHASFLHVFRNCIIFIVITSVVLRIALRNVALTALPPRQREGEQKG